MFGVFPGEPSGKTVPGALAPGDGGAFRQRSTVPSSRQCVGGRGPWLAPRWLHFAARDGAASELSR